MSLKTRGRPPGQKNKSKFIGIKLKDLNNLFSPEATILVSSDYSNVINISNLEVVQNVTLAPKEEKKKTEVKVFDFNNS